MARVSLLQAANLTFDCTLPVTLECTQVWLRIAPMSVHFSLAVLLPATAGMHTMVADGCTPFAVCSAMQNLREAIAGYRGRLMHEGNDVKRNALLQVKHNICCLLVSPVMLLGGQGGV